MPLYLFLSVLLSCALLQTDDWQLAYRVSLSFSAISAGGDGSFFGITNGGEVVKYGDRAAEEARFSPTAFARPTQIEAGNPLQILLSDEGGRELLLLDRFLRLVERVDFSAQGAVFFSAVTLGAGNVLWAFDAAAHRLLKIDLQSKNVRFSVYAQEWQQAGQVSKITFLREYKHFLFAFSPGNGLLVFDLMGNFRHHYPISQPRQVGFFEDFCYYLGVEGKTIVRINLFSGHKLPPIKLPEKAEQLLYFGNRIYLTTPQKTLCLYLSQL